MATRRPQRERTAAEEAPDAEQETDTDESDVATGAETVAAGERDGSIDRIVEEMIQAQTADLEDQLEEVERQVEELDNFARISLNGRKIKQAEENLSEFSESLTRFAEKAFNNINTLEERLDVQALLLAAIVDALADEDVDLDLTAVKRYQQERIVTTASPDTELEKTIERH